MNKRIKDLAELLMERSLYQLHGDEGDVTVDTHLRQEVLAWCQTNNITAESPLSPDNRYLSAQYFGVDVWRIKDPQQRSWFVLRWA